MALGTPAVLGTANSKTSSTSIAVTTSAAVSTKDLLFVAVVVDNVSTANCITSVSDSVDGNYTLATNLRSTATTDSSTEVAIYYLQNATASSGSRTVTVTFNTSRTAKAAIWGRESGIDPTSALYAVATGTELVGATNGSCSISSVPSSYFSFGTVGWEGPSTDSFSISLWNIFGTTSGTTGSGAASNASISAAYKTNNPSGTVSFSPTLNTARDGIILLAIFLPDFSTHIGTMSAAESTAKDTITSTGWTERLGTVGISEAVYPTKTSITTTGLTSFVGGIAYSPTNNIFVASDGNQIYSSVDATTWTQRHDPTDNTAQDVRGIIWGNGQFVSSPGGTASTKYSISTNGTSWTEYTLPTGANRCSITYANNVYLLGESTTYGGNTWTSTDAITWTATGLASAEGDFTRVINNVFTRFTGNTTIKDWSSSGTSWTDISYYTAGDLGTKALTYYNGYYYAINANISGTSQEYVYRDTGLSNNTWVNLFNPVLGGGSDAFALPNAIIIGQTSSPNSQWLVSTNGTTWYEYKAALINTNSAVSKTGFHTFKDGTLYTLDEGANTLAKLSPVLDSASMSGTVSGGGTITGTVVATESTADSFASTGDVFVQGTLATTESTADSFASTGDVIVQGSLSVTEVGTDSFAATGNITDATSTGTLSSTETGIDSFASTGDVFINGSLATTETGVDSFASTGDVFINGSLATTETGVDSFASTGKVIVKGSLASTETGTDSFASNGSILVKGSLTVTETGTDSFASTGSILVKGSLNTILLVPDVKTIQQNLSNNSDNSFSVNTSIDWLGGFAYFKGVYVYSLGSRIVTSIDNYNFTLRYTSQLYIDYSLTDNFYSLINSNDLLVLTTQGLDIGTYNGQYLKYYTSIDGINWVARNLPGSPGTTDYFGYDIRFIDNYWYYYDDNGDSFISIDGINWTINSNGYNSDLRTSRKILNSNYITDYNKTKISNDGINWTTRANFVTNYTLASVSDEILVYFNNYYYFITIYDINYWPVLKQERRILIVRNSSWTDTWESVFSDTLILSGSSAPPLATLHNAITVVDNKIYAIFQTSYSTARVVSSNSGDINTWSTPTLTYDFIYFQPSNYLFAQDSIAYINNKVVNAYIDYDSSTIKTISLLPSESDYFTSAGKPQRYGPLTTTEVGADSFASTGSILIKGSLAVTETGTDSFASTGTVASASSTGTLAATETGTDSFASTGTILVQGSFTTTETGVDSFASTGKVIVKGSLSTTEAGTDSFASTGKVIVKGSLSTTELGTDSFASTGDVIVQGSLASTETGTDSFASTGGVFIKGSLASTEIGADSFLANGTNQIIGILATTEVGVDSSASTGKVIVQGAINSTESIADSFASTGDVFVKGHLASTEAGTDSFASTGSVFIKGSLTVVEITIDSFASTGDVIVQGSLSSTEVGTDSFASTGDVIVQGSLASTETGTDNLSANGSSQIIGNLASTETGTDSFASTGSIPIKGSLTVTETGTDNLSANGSSQIIGNLASTEIGIDSFASTGSIPIKGSISAIELAQDITNITGKIYVNGILSTTEVGADTLSANGTNQIIGTLSTTETGTDSFTSTGSIPIKGLVSATELSQDIASLTGKVKVQGNSTLTEIGLDNFISYGGIPNIGNFIGYEVGEDTFFSRYSTSNFEYQRIVSSSISYNFIRNSKARHFITEN